MKPLAELSEANRRLAAKQEGLRQAAATMSAIERVDRTTEEAKKRALQRSALTAAEQERLRKPVSDVVAARVTWEATDERFAEIAKGMKTALASAPPDKKPGLEGALRQLKAGRDAARDATDAREEYGSPAVDAIPQHEAELMALWEQAKKADKK